METRTAEQVRVELRDVPPEAAALQRSAPGPAPEPREPSASAAIFNRPRRSFLSRYGTALLVAGSVATGAVLHAVVEKAGWLHRAPAVAATTPRRIAGPLTLHGPGGPVTLPMSTPVVVNIWLEGCADCQPAVEAWKAMKGSLDVAGLPVVNVAYGGASTTWAAENGLDDRLVLDPSGGALVRPLRIGTFTTFIIDADGWIRWQDRPDNRGFADRLSGATRVLASGERPPAVK